MSDKLPQQPQNEEVDLGQLFNAIGRLFEKLFALIGRILKGLLSAFIFAIKPLIVNAKLVGAALVVSTILGFVLQSTKKPVYYSKMIVKANFDSKYQLASNIDYFNALIGSRHISELSNIFEIDSSIVKELVAFDLKAGPETQNDLFIEYDEYVQSIDTSLVDELSYKEYVKNRDLLSGSRFTIKAEAYKKDIFPYLQVGFRKTFENEFSKHQKHVRDTMAHIERVTLNTELSRLDSIQKTYLEVLRNESKNKGLTLGLNTGIPIQEEKTLTKEYDLFIKEQEIRRNLNFLNKSVAEENTYFDVLSSFTRLGSEDKSINQRYFILFPTITLILLMLMFLFIKVFNFIKNYE